MANAPTPSPQRPMPQGDAGGATYRPLWLAIVFVALVVFSLPTIILVVFGMMPTIVAYIIDRTEQKYATFSVGSMNLCGTFPYLLDVWFGDHTWEQALGILTDAFALLAIFGAAAFGWMLYTSIPPVVSAILVMMAERRVAELKLIQQGLVNEWGPSVSTPPTPPPAQVRPRRRR